MAPCSLLRTGLGEGLVGRALKELRPLCVADASKQPGYRFFEELHEEPFESFLAVPIRRGITRIGMMVELPSVVDIIEACAREADFLSIGTNDFIQFMLGVDRTNEHVARFYIPYHPSVLRAIHRVARAAVEQGKEVSVCGDMAHEEPYIPFLLGIGIRTFSLDAAYLPRIQEAVSRIAIAEAETHAQEVLRQTRASDVARLLGCQAHFGAT